MWANNERKIMNNQTNLYIKDQEILKVIELLEKDDENSLKEAIKVLLIVTADTRRFLRQVYKEMPKNVQKVYTKPTGNKEDIIIGEQKDERITYKGTGEFPNQILPMNSNVEAECDRNINGKINHENL